MLCPRTPLRPTTQRSPWQRPTRSQQTVPYQQQQEQQKRAATSDTAAAVLSCPALSPAVSASRPGLLVSFLFLPVFSFVWLTHRDGVYMWLLVLCCYNQACRCHRMGRFMTSSSGFVYCRQPYTSATSACIGQGNGGRGIHLAKPYRPMCQLLSHLQGLLEGLESVGGAPCQEHSGPATDTECRLSAGGCG